MNGRVSDWIGDAPLIRINTIHHTLALFPSSSPGVQHINHQVEDIDDIMRSYYFLQANGVRIVFGPGRHPTSSACFLYFEGPDGMIYEYSMGVKHIRPEEEASYRPRQFPFTPESLCMWARGPTFPSFVLSRHCRRRRCGPRRRKVCARKARPSAGWTCVPPAGLRRAG